MEQDYATRLEWFRQFKRTTSVSNNILVVGIDISKDKHYAFFGGPGGRAVLKRLIFENSIGGFEALLFNVNSHLAKEKGFFKLSNEAEIHYVNIEHVDQVIPS